MKCPVCRAAYRSKGNLSPADWVINDTQASSPEKVFTQVTCLCHRCGTDLTELIHLHDQAVKHYRQAVANFCQGEYAQAKSQNEQAIALHHGIASFHALAGQLSLMEGEFSQAISAWQQAIKLDPDQKVARDGFYLLHQVVARD
jgi:tetratricopeptide (TPR) repeat protein